jgi:capsular exopolysaccharide synthesis family protein
MAGATALAARRRESPAISIALERDRIDARLVSLLAPDSFEAEQYRKLRYALEEMRKAGEGSVVAVCSPSTGDGKSLTALNLAGALAQDPAAKVLLIDADIRRRSAVLRDALALGARVERGLVDALLEPGLALEDVELWLPEFNLAVLPAGVRPVPPYELLRSARLGDLIAQARLRFDHVVVDAPPILPVSDCKLLGRWVDAFLMVVAAHRTARHALEEALDLIDARKVLGIVFNRSDASDADGYGYGYGDYGDYVGYGTVGRPPPAPR